jgi:4'-phosphopantetheinyl transferase EntD
VGFGIDLCAANRFEGRPGRRDRAQLLLTEHERALAPSLWPGNLPLAYATLFAAKEAAFKATAAPLRRWYEKHDDELRYGVRHFVMEEPLLMSGTERNGAAQRALDAMGIARIEVRYAQIDGMALVAACALAY